jgi:hypothetical protein
MRGHNGTTVKRRYLKVLSNMGTRPYTKLNDIKLDITLDSIVVEIGSENGEGSSLWLYNWAKERNLEFYSIDVEHSKRETDYPDINWIVTNSGSDWCKNILPSLNKKIKVLYLDNFDWISDSNKSESFIQKQIEDYAKRGVMMNNQNCQDEHRLQVEYCLPFLDEQSVVIMDDTYYANDTQLVGKCATAIPVLQLHGFQMSGTEYAIRGYK